VIGLLVLFKGEKPDHFEARKVKQLIQPYGIGNA
jgi:hypothetical protein